MKLELRLDSERVRAGEQIKGQITVLEGGQSQSLTMTISFHERSPGYDATPFTDSGVVHEGELPTGAVIDFRYPVPDSALPSVKGEHGELFWEVEAVSDDPGFDTRVRRPLKVVTEG